MKALIQNQREEYLFGYALFPTVLFFIFILQAYIANEPDENELSNCYLVLVSVQNSYEIGQPLLLKLVSSRDINPGEEITW